MTPSSTNEREEFGFKRVACDCRKCSVWCEKVPGYLVPSDLERLIPDGDDPLAWAEENLRASPGFAIPELNVSIPSLVPRRQQTGHCHWLQDGLCTIHERSPYGCAFLSQCKQTDGEAARINTAGRTARLKSFEDGTLYSEIWKHLWEMGLRELGTQSNIQQAVVTIRRIERREDRRERRKRKKLERKRK